MFVGLLGEGFLISAGCWQL